MPWIVVKPPGPCRNGISNPRAREKVRQKKKKHFNLKPKPLAMQGTFFRLPSGLCLTVLLEDTGDAARRKEHCNVHESLKGTPMFPVLYYLVEP